MRLWSLHPRFLDAKGLVALWREGLLAKAVLEGKTRGYTHHPQLERFRAAGDPLAAINAFLTHVAREAEQRGYSFDVAKIDVKAVCPKIPVTRGQLEFEWNHLKAKLLVRDPQRAQALATESGPECSPAFARIEGPVESWERP